MFQGLTVEFSKAAHISKEEKQTPGYTVSVTDKQYDAHVGVESHENICGQRDQEVNSDGGNQHLEETS